MKIAFVSQPIDTVIPPKQNSVGACTYWAARPFARSAKVLVYGSKDINPDPSAVAAESGITFRFFATTWSNRSLFKVRREYYKLFGSGSPVSTSRWMFPEYGRQVARDIAKEKCDVIHLQHCSQYIPVMRAHNPNAKIVLHLHGEWFSQTNPAALTDRLEQIDLLTTVGNHITEKTRRMFPRFADRCQTTYNGIDPREFERERDYEAQRKRPLKRIMYSGAISPHKGLHILLQAFVIVARQFPDVVLDIIGPIGNYPIEENFDLRDDQKMIQTIRQFYDTGVKTSLKARLRPGKSGDQKYAQHLKSIVPPDLTDKVCYRGFVTRSELVESYYDADIFAFAPIWDEGFGLPPAEAMASGLPVVTTRSGTVPEIVINGTTGFVVEKNNVEELARALLMMLEDDNRREAMGRAGRRRMFQHFLWDTIAEDMRVRYEALCQQPVSAI